jgi:LacI family transcriptional regulator
MVGKRTSIVDVANRAGVSKSTVSKAFNDRSDISVLVRDRILDVAAELNYVPNALVRTLRRGRSNTVGLYVWETIHQPWPSILSSLTRGFAMGIKELGCDMLYLSHFSQRTPERLAATILDGRVDGFISVAGAISQPGLSALAHASLATVVIYSQDVPDGIGYVAIDNASGIFAAVDHLVKYGHRRIAFYAPGQTNDYIERAEAYAGRLRYHGITPDPNLMIVATLIVPDYAEACRSFFSADNPPTAVIAGSDDIALQIMNWLEHEGMRVPDDVSVVGFDGVAQDYSIPITSVRQRANDVGRTAAEFVGAMLRGAPPNDCRVVLPVEFAPSKSSGPVTPSPKRINRK